MIFILADKVRVKMSLRLNLLVFIYVFSEKVLQIVCFLIEKNILFCGYKYNKKTIQVLIIVKRRIYRYNKGENNNLFFFS